jgi:hypothetical protein
MTLDPPPQPGSVVLARQIPLLLHLLRAAQAQSPLPPGSILAQPIADVLNGGHPANFVHNGMVIQALCAESLRHLNAGQHADALAWGKAAYVTNRRFVHCWLTFIEIAAASGALPGYIAPDPDAAIPAGPIPRRIVQFWDNPEVPQDVAKLIDGWKQGAPDFTHHLFNDTMAQQFIGDQYGEEALLAYRACEHVAGKSDLFRLAWLAKNGGVYIDADDACVGDLRLLLPAHAGLVLNWSPGPPPCINNWFVAVRPDHPIIHKMWQEALHNLTETKRHGLRLSPWITTGPGLYTMALLDEVVLADAIPESLTDLSFQREAQYRVAVSPVHDLEYRKTSDGNWKLAY